MGKSLVIVESPAKAKTINKYLGNDFIVKSSVGHIRDLPTKAPASANDPKARAAEAAKVRKMAPEDKEIYKAARSRRQLVRRMGIDPENDWKADYQILPGKEKVVDELKRLAKDADHIYLATDLDREGEAIAWHLREAIGGDESRYQRVVFNEITKTAIQAAFADPGELNMDQVDAQQARRFLDRVVGFMVSPLLWAKIARGLSAGRVQSVAVKLVVEREKEIRAFNPEEYWEVKADLDSTDKQAFIGQVFKYQGSDFRPNSEAQTNAALAELEQQDFVVQRRTDKATSSRPSAPYITSTLQQAASTRLGFGVKKTMMMAQRLYEAGYITYMRTDSTNLSADAVNACRDYIQQRHGAKYLPEQANSYSSKSGAQDAHEAIRPSNVDISPGDLGDMEVDARRLYQMIWQQFVACQMTPAEFTATTITVAAGDYEMQCKGRVTRFDGYLSVMPARDEDDELPDLQTGDAMSLLALIPQQHFTKPTARYSEAALVKDLEKRGIGRPSTYASIIQTLLKQYIVKDKGRFIPEDRGRLVTTFLGKFFDRYVEYNFTAKLETQLDEVSAGTLDWKVLLAHFWDDFQAAIDNTKDLTITNVLDVLDEELGPHFFQADEGGILKRSCPNCDNGRLGLKLGKFGAFVGCSNYPECKFTRPLSKAKAAAQSQLAEPKFIGKHENGNDIFLKNGRFGPYLQYEKIPEEKTEEKITKKKKKTKKLKADVNELLKNVSIPKGLELKSIDLEKAQFLCSLPKSLGLNPENQKEITLNTGRFGPYLKCENKSARIENIEEIFSIGLNRAITLIAEAKPGRMSSSIIKDLGEHPEDKKPVRVMKGQYGPYIKYKSLNATIPEEKDPTDLTMEEALILIEKREEYDKNKKSKKKKKGK